jgi:hypothetical protein
MSSPRRPPHRPQRRTTIGPASRTHAYTAEAVSDDITDALSRASTEELLLELRRRIIRPRYRRQDWDDGDGLDASGGWPEEG